MADKASKNKDDESFVPFYETGAQIYMSLKLSKDGLSREEDVDVLKGMYDDEKARNIGWKVRRQVFSKAGTGENGDGTGQGT